MTLEVRKIFKIKKCVVKGGRKLLEATSFHKRNIFLRGQAEDSFMLNNDRACMRGCEMQYTRRLAIDTCA